MGMFMALVLSMTTPLWTAADGAGVERITKESLKGMLDNPHLVIVDVRTKKHWESSSQKIKGAVREDPEDVEAWMSKYEKEKTLVFYCR
jgi:rhodanese-related sulfurtransferase